MPYISSQRGRPGMIMADGFQHYLRQAAALFGEAAEGDLGLRVERAIETISQALSRRLPLLICGNGGSAADAMHIAGELVGRFLLDRPALKVLALVADPAVLTAWSNDFSYESVFARQVEAHGEAGGVLLAISTSGNSPNVIAAVKAAQARQMTAIGLTGEGGGALAALCDLLLDVPSRETPRVQELHLCLYHYLCREVERRTAPAPSRAPA